MEIVLSHLRIIHAKFTQKYILEGNSPPVFVL